MEKELFAKNALCESLDRVLENVLPEQVLLGAIMELQTADIADLQQKSVKDVVADLRLLQSEVTELKGLVAELKDAATEENAIGLDEDDNDLLAAVEATYSINGGSDKCTAIDAAIELFKATSVEQLCTAQARAAISDLAHLCSAFVKLRAEFKDYFKVEDWNTSDEDSDGDHDTV